MLEKTVYLSAHAGWSKWTLSSDKTPRVSTKEKGTNLTSISVPKFGLRDILNDNDLTRDV